jgi:signal transduction histidine kinase
MNGILGLTDLVLDGELDHDQRDTIEMVKTSADSLMGILNDILDVSKIEAGFLRLEEVEFSLRHLVEAALAAMSISARQKGLELKWHVDPDCPDLWIGDPFRLRQVLVNLAGNGVKFTNAGCVTVDVRCVEMDGNAGKITFRVEDTGIGIAPHQLETIFHPFRQGDGSMTRRFGGTGLGLSISNTLVHMMGGEIHVYSSLGQGSVFTFTILLRSLTSGRAAVPSSAVPVA